MPSRRASTVCRRAAGRLQRAYDREGLPGTGCRFALRHAGAVRIGLAAFGRKTPERLRCARSGQGTVEYAVVFAALLALVVGLGAIWRLFDGGAVVQHALQSASHHVQSAAAGAIGDVFQY